MCVDDYILLNVHLTSKQEKNIAQSAELVDGLKQLARAYPKAKIIAGGDINSFLEERYLRDYYRMHPR